VLDGELRDETLDLLIRQIVGVSVKIQNLDQRFM
jgi:hypothetical protein